MLPYFATLAPRYVFFAPRSVGSMIWITVYAALKSAEDVQWSVGPW